MGIKTRFNPMGGSAGEKGRLSDWRYETLANGQIVLYEYLGTYSSAKPVYVPMKKGKTTINNYTSGTTTTASNTPFYNNPNVISVDLQNVPFVNNSMDNAFHNCRNLTSVNSINQNVTNMYRTFQSCDNFNQNIQIPNSVTDMPFTFYYCTNLNQNIQIPNSVTNMSYAFFYCTNLNQNIQIPNSVTNMSWTFYYCTNLNQNIQIPNSVTNMSRTFYYCNLQGTITINSVNITNTNYCFYGSGLTKNVIFPSRYINNTYTPTRNSLATAATGGYAVGTAAGNLVNNTAQNAVFYAYDPVSWEGYNAWVGDGENWRLTKWGGIGKAAGQTSIKVPTSITSYDTFPTVISNTCFYAVSGLEEIDCNHVPIYPATSTNFFAGIQGDTPLSVYNFNCDSTTQMYCLLYASHAINSFSTGTPQIGTCFLNMPETIANGQAMFGGAKGISNFYVTSAASLKTYRMYNACNTRDINIYMNYSTASNTTEMYYQNVRTTRKNIHIYYTYSNGVATNTYNSYKSTAYMGTSGNSVTLASPHYNSTTNFYIYNLSQNYCPTTNNSWWCCPVNGALRYTGAGYSDDTRIDFPISLSVQQYPDKYTTVSTNTQNMSNMFNGFFKINCWIDVPSTATNLSWAFANCYSLNQPITNYGTSGLWPTWGVAIPNSVTDLSFAFYGCSNLNQKVEVVNSVTNLRQTFRYATGLQGNVFIYSQDVTNAESCFGSTWLEKNVYIPYTYTNGVNTQTFNAFKTAGYLFANGVSNSQHGVTVYDLNA